MNLACSEAESMLLSAFLRDAMAVGAICVDAGVSRTMFTVPENGEFFAYLVDRYCDGKPMARFSIGRDLKTKGLLESVGGHDRVQELFLIEGVSAAAPEFIGIIKETHARRTIAQVAHKAYEDAQGYEPVENIQANLRTLLSAGVAPTDLEIRTPRQLNSELLDRAESNATISTQFPCIDNRVGPLQRGDLLVIGGKRKAGKSILATQIAANIARNHFVAIFTIEMNRLEVWRRVIASESRVSTAYWNPDFKANKGQYDAVHAAMKRLATLKIAIIDRVTDIEQAIGVAHMLKAKHGDMGAFVLDYLQLFTMKGSQGASRAELVSQASMASKRAATALQCVGIVVSQLNDDGKALDSRGPERDCNIMLNVEAEDDGSRKVMCAYNRSGVGNVMLPIEADLQFARFNPR